MKVYNFPTFPIRSQLFHVPGAVAEGGYTSGGARITSPEPGGFSVLEIQPSLTVGEWQYPLASWLMSKGNGQILRVRLAPTPQILSARAATVQWSNDQPWSNQQNWSGDMTGTFIGDALEGTNIVVIAALTATLRPGHVIGHQSETYLVDEVDGQIVTVTPPLRRDVKSGDPVYFRSWFTGSISNPSDFRATYDAENVGNIQLGKIVLNEVIVS